jgi:predicted phosphodiesterase
MDDSTRSRLVGRLGGALLALLVGGGGAAIALLVAGGLRYPIGPFTVEFHALPGAAVTAIALPPLGEIHADTHLTPLTLRATLESVDPERLNALIQERSVESVVILVERVTREAIRSYAFRAAGIALVGSVLAALVIHRTNGRALLGAVASGLLLIVAAGATTWLTYRPEAFREPAYTGSLRLAPQLVGPIEEAGARIEAFRAELRRLVGGTVRAYGALAAQPAPSPAATVLLHISDIHASPLGMDFAQELAQTFDADLVVDTGDITSFGTPLESAVLERIPQFGVPYVFVRGNHDSAAVAGQIENLPNGDSLENEAVDVEGLTVAGAAHPLFTPDPNRSYTDEEIEAAVAEAGLDLAGVVASLKPDVVAVHDDRMAATVIGRVPLVLSGHFHRFDTEVVEGTLFLQVGSTGAGGLDTFVQDEPLPLTAEVLYFEGSPPRLVAIDRVALDPETRELRVARELVPASGEGAEGAVAKGPARRPALGLKR